MIDAVLQKELRDKYNPDGSPLRESQMRILEIMREVDKICRRNNIDYWLSSGTLLGAVRHNGFIPWDDDIDIEIMYKDRSRFIKACEEELPRHLFVQNAKTDPGYYTNILKICDKGSDIHSMCYIRGVKYPVSHKYKGYFIDVFTEEKAFPFLVRLSNKMTALLLYVHYKFHLNHRATILVFNINNCIFACFRFMSRLFNRSDEYYHSYGCLFNSSRNGTDLLPVKDVAFESSLFRAPANPPRYLTKMFGDYMKLPSELERCGHHIGTER